jgi:RNA polymerase sigma-70 factor (ECF subfamily)
VPEANPDRNVMTRENEARWQRLTRLLEPIHPQAIVTARRLCRSAAEGDDLYQDAVVRAFDKLHGLREESRFRAWFFAILLSRHRSGRRRLRLMPVPLEEAFPNGSEPAGTGGPPGDDERLAADRAARALATLPAVQREAVVLHEIEGFSVDEVAEIQGVTASAVKSRLSRGRRTLRQWYERNTVLETNRGRRSRLAMQGETS